jgi:tetratricopeptide (TPR) repeat protein
MPYQNLISALLIAAFSGQVIASSALAAQEPVEQIFIPITPLPLPDKPVIPPQRLPFNRLELPSTVCFSSLVEKYDSIVTLPNLRNLSSKSESLADIAVQYAIAGQYEKAVNVAQTIPNVNYKAPALTKIASYLRKQSPLQAKRLMTQAEQLIPQLEAGISQELVLDAIAVEYAIAGDFKLALETAQKISQPGIKYDTIREIALQYVVKGNLKQAIALIQTFVKDEFTQEAALVKIAHQYAVMGNYTQAFDFISTLKKDQLQAEALEQVFSRALQVGQTDLVIKQISTIPNDCTKLITVLMIAQNNTYQDEPISADNKLKRLNLSLAIAAKLKTDQQQIEALEVILSQYINAGKIEEVWKLSQTFLSGKAKDLALAFLAQYYMENQQHEKALSLAETIQDSAIQVKTLNDISNSYLKIGKLDQATQILEKALTISQQKLNHDISLEEQIDDVPYFPTYVKPPQ